MSIQPNAAPIIYYNPKSKPAVFFEAGNHDVDYWYCWKKTSLHDEDYEPVREYNAISGPPNTVLTRLGWNHIFWYNILTVGNKIEVLFMGPGKTPFVRQATKTNEILFKSYLKTHRKLVRDINIQCIAQSPPPFYKIAGKKPHFPDIVKKYDGWPQLR
jgi:hypothetical protein